MDFLSKFNWVDVLILIVIVRTVYVSFQDGLGHEILPMIGSFCMLVLSLHFYNKLATLLYNGGLALPIALLNALSFAATAITIGIVFGLIKDLADKIIKINWNPVVDRFGGLLVGVLRAALTVCIILTFIVIVPLSYLKWSVNDRSFMGNYFLKIGPAIYDRAYAILPVIKISGSPADARQMINNLASSKNSTKSSGRDPALKR